VSSLKRLKSLRSLKRLKRLRSLKHPSAKKKEDSTIMAEKPFSTVARMARISSNSSAQVTAQKWTKLRLPLYISPTPCLASANAISPMLHTCLAGEKMTGTAPAKEVAVDSREMEHQNSSINAQKTRSMTASPNFKCGK
jgi:hypothetical protein